MDIKIDIIEHRNFGILRIPERHMVEADASVCDIVARIGRVMKRAFLIDDLCDTSCAGNTHGDHNEYHGQHHQTHQNVHTVGEQREQITGLKGTSDNHVCTEPADQKDTGVYRKLHQW